MIIACIIEAMWDHNGISMGAKIVVIGQARLSIVITTRSGKIANQFLLLGVDTEHRKPFIEKTVFELLNLFELLIALKDLLGGSRLEVLTLAEALRIK